MKRIKLIIPLLLAATTLVLQGCGEAEGGANTAEETKNFPSVEVMKVEGKSFTDVISVLGQIKPVEKAKLSFLEGGILERILVKKGNKVSKGDTIALMDNKALKAALDAAKAQYELAEITFQKQETIFKDNVNSEYQYLQSKYNRDQMKANLNLAEKRYDDTFIKAPFDGIVNDNYFDEGEFCPPGTPIFELINVSNLKVVAGIPENYLGQVKTGAEANVKIPYIDKELKGRVSFVGAAISTSNRTIPVEILVSNPGSIIKPEIVANVYIEIKSYENIVTIPDEVVVRTDSGYSVFVAENETAVSKEVEILSRFEGKIAVSDGLNPGDELIVVGYQNLVNGEKVNIVR
ncbi:MAG: efflux RND transporter periplasmic adaptor subunit [Ignavibacterium sp.]|nr:efflux RND transporter periplasmic adaptor subunit [Melioribacteraceae bacterium]MDD5609861.1 efflux RND transporter periplasmic adaptor subunit [Ignavibacterium sp.]